MRKIEVTYIAGPFTGPNRARRRELEAQARHKSDTPHGLGSLPAPPKKHVARAHEARHLHTAESADEA